MQIKGGNSFLNYLQELIQKAYQLGQQNASTPAATVATSLEAAAEA